MESAIFTQSISKKTRLRVASFRVWGQLEHDRWLCGASESRLLDAMQREHTIIVNEHLLLKFQGRLAALCLKDFTAPDGSEFKKGIWYAPHGPARDFYKEAYHRGLTKVTTEEEHDWAYIRQAQNSTRYDEDKQESVNMSPQELVEIGIQYAKQVKGEQLSPEQARKRWENTYPEDY